ncbi:MAG TPA: type 1 glutamine amidotransferase [Candidatus Acidoferrales bacterium]|nr:type 1 glutamine amidotransferase [Candidatus Acidoferrales bacterium]
MTGRVLAFRHVPFEGVGRIERILVSHGFAVDYADLYKPSTAPVEADLYRAFIFMGGPMSVNDDLAYLRREEESILDAVARRVPVLGICLGAQLIAHALGAQVRRNPVKEIGWFEIEFTPAAAEDPMFRLFSAREMVFHWHGETFDLPPGAVLLASSERCRNQAFRVGASVYGLQFHPEMTAEMIADWCRQDENCGDIRELGEPIDPAAHIRRLADAWDPFFDRWCATIPKSYTGGYLMATDPEQKSDIEPPGLNNSAQADVEEPEPASFEQPVCPRCGWHNTRLSHTSNALDNLLRLFALRAYRCRSCGNRFRSISRRPR